MQWLYHIIEVHDCNKSLSHLLWSMVKMLLELLSSSDSKFTGLLCPVQKTVTGIGWIALVRSNPDHTFGLHHSITAGDHLVQHTTATGSNVVLNWRVVTLFFLEWSLLLIFHKQTKILESPCIAVLIDSTNGKKKSCRLSFKWTRLRIISWARLKKGNSYDDCRGKVSRTD